MNDLQIFKNPEFGQVRTVTIEGNPWFVGKDVAVALGYGDGNPNSKSLNNAIADHVDEEDKGVTKMETPGGPQNVIIINESGLYALIFGSKLESAKRFKRWVTSEVLPALRKTGTYALERKTSIREVVDLIRVTRETMKEQGIAPEEIARAIKEIGEQHGIDFPEYFIRPEKLTLSNAFDMLDFIFAHKGDKKKPTYDDFIIYQASVQKIEDKNSPPVLQH